MSVVPFSCIFVPELLVSASVCCFVLLYFLQESLYTTVYSVSIILFKIKNIESVKLLDWAFIICTEKKNPLLRTAHSFLRTPPTSWVLSMAQWRTGISLCSRYWKKQVFFLIFKLKIKMHTNILSLLPTAPHLWTAWTVSGSYPDYFWRSVTSGTERA